ncbi:hypothetical protein [Stenoxybacter acetivorans]|uniref:hypothetical protein n=1 Tax=Stenoxybacter acetivorans TaxID=422441 RepID=UPI00055FA9E9|nr:hypothetical protein [Stenoxybacter acetivorans]
MKQLISRLSLYLLCFVACWGCSSRPIDQAVVAYSECFREVEKEYPRPEDKNAVYPVMATFEYWNSEEYQKWADMFDQKRAECMERKGYGQYGQKPKRYGQKPRP